MYKQILANKHTSFTLDILYLSIQARKIGTNLPCRDKISRRYLSVNLLILLPPSVYTHQRQDSGAAPRWDCNFYISLLIHGLDSQIKRSLLAI